MKICTGRGLFFLFKECAVLLAKGMTNNYVNGCIYHSVYLDKYGEEDTGFRRGKPLFFEPGRYEQLRQLWLGANFDDTVLQRGNKFFLL